MANDVTLNLPTVVGGKIVHSIDIGDGLQRQVCRMDQGSGNVESIVSTTNPLVVTSEPKAPSTFRLQVTSTQTNTSLVAPGFLWRLTSISVMSKTYSSTSYDNPSIIIGIGPTTTPTNAQVVFAHPGIAPGTGYCLQLNDVGAGGVADKLLFTTGTIANDVLEIFGVYYPQ